jgi:predicted nucleic acid-binding protein
MRLNRLRAGLLYLPHSRATNGWYARVSNIRKALRSAREGGRGAGDADMWIIASALEHGLGLVSHDRHQVLLAVEAGVRVFTNIHDVRHVNTLTTRSGP